MVDVTPGAAPAEGETPPPLTGAAWFADVDTPASLAIDTNYRVRVRLENAGSVAGTGFKWQYKLNSGSWTNITTSSSVVKAVNSPFYADGDDVPDLLGGLGIYQSANHAADTTGAVTLGSTLVNSVEAEMAFQIVGGDVANDDTILLRIVYGDGSVLESYDVTPTITVVSPIAQNLPPTANAGADQVVNEGDIVTLLGSGFDPDGTITAYLWQQLSGPTVALSNPAVAQPTFTAPQVITPTLLSFLITVTDNNGATAQDTVNVTVNDVPAESPPGAAAPTADAGQNHNAVVGGQVQLDGSASALGGSESGVLQYSWSQVSGPPVSLSSATVVNPTFIIPPDFAAPVTLRFSLTVFDGTLTSAPDTVDIYVLPATGDLGPGGVGGVQFATGQESIPTVDHLTEMQDRLPSFMKGDVNV